VGKEIDFNGKSHSVVGLATAVAMQPDIAFSAGGETSVGSKFAAAGTTVIDNSSAWRMDPTKIDCS
jgi:aspartate-semialdehyde dehydrogenase